LLNNALKIKFIIFNEVNATEPRKKYLKRKALNKFGLPRNWGKATIW